MNRSVHALTLLVIAPLLMASQPADCPPSGVEVQAEILTVEQTTYTCALSPLADGPGCVDASRSEWSECRSDGIELQLADHTTRSIPVNSLSVTRTCDLPAGNHAVTLCVPGGSLRCDLELGPGRPGVNLGVKSSAPYRFRYRVRADRDVPELGGTTFTLVSNDVALAARTRHSFRFLFVERSVQPYVIDRCNVDQTRATRAPQHGCGHCSTGEPGLLVVIAAAIAVALRRRC